MKFTQPTQPTAPREPASETQVVECKTGDWTVTIENGECRILDPGGRCAHRSRGHEATAAHLAMALDGLREMLATTDPGPQSGPASLPQINAQVEQARREVEVCPECYGFGYIGDNESGAPECDCPTCGGTGNAQVAEARQENERLRTALSRQNDEICQVLGKALQDLEAAEQDRSKLLQVVKGVRGALADAGDIPVPTIVELLEAAVRQVVGQRDELRDYMDRIAESLNCNDSSYELSDHVKQMAEELTTLRARLATAAEVKRGPCELWEGQYEIYYRQLCGLYSGEGPYQLPENAIAIRLAAKEGERNLC